MEITSVHWSGSLLQQEYARNSHVVKASFEVSPDVRATFEVPESAPQTIDFTEISPKVLREVALGEFNAGNIDQDTYYALAQELPMQAVDSTGSILDLSTVTDDSPFDFKTYYHDQLQLALAVGDDDKASTLNSVLSFLEG
jgi:hypothetical protein